MLFSTAVVSQPILAKPADMHPCPGYISANAVRPLPPDARIDVRPTSDSRIDRALREQALFALRAAGRNVGEPATHVLSWRGSLDVQEGASSLPELYGSAEASQGSDDLRWLENLPRQPWRRRAAPPVKLRLDAFVELRDVASGRIVWTGVLSCERRGGDQDALIGVLSRAVAPTVGQTILGREF
ncbi:hypothetical protein [Roseomonas chloroacetimidivorans]|uniref:hypothetical protein n=1 Tax=Roseomonas chloroacetimidivorans TaxID=1766656 RepID=UPI003C72D87D